MLVLINTVGISTSTDGNRYLLSYKYLNCTTAVWWSHSEAPLEQQGCERTLLKGSTLRASQAPGVGRALWWNSGERVYWSTWRCVNVKCVVIRVGFSVEFLLNLEDLFIDPLNYCDI